VIWLGWRQQRTETLIAGALLVFVAAILVPVGIDMAHVYSQDGLSHCLGFSSSRVCGEAVGSFQQRFNRYTALVGWFNLVPGLFGVALAAPFVLELERGTHRLAWTQSITRRRWVVTKLALAVASTLTAATILLAIYLWWRAPLVRIEGRMESGAFDSQGTVVLGYSLFALGLALAIGALWRRAIPAVMASFVAYFAARIFVDTWLRQRFIEPRSLTFHAGSGEPRAMFHAWVISERPSDAHGSVFAPPFGACLRAGRAVLNEKRCLAIGGGDVRALFEPAARFWALQGIETALFAGTGLALIAFAGWWTLHRE
jgi:hypothetical protein